MELSTVLVVGTAELRFPSVLLEDACIGRRQQLE